MSAFAPVSSFEGLALHHTPILDAIRQAGYKTPTPIQAEAMPPLLAGRDLIGQASTGTGKTAAFAIPILARLELARIRPQALVLVPTRELAIQAAGAFQNYARYLPNVRVLPLYGGQPMGNQLRQLKRGAHIIVGTPGRLMDHLRRSSLSLAQLTTVILDEADEMLKMGFIEDVEWILGQVPAERQTAVFSATLPASIRSIANRHLYNALDVKIKGKTVSLPSIAQRYCLVPDSYKLDALNRLLEVEDVDAALIFARTKAATEELAKKLEVCGYATAALHGDIPQARREKVIERLKKRTLHMIVATDVAARGLDVQRISHVVNYDIPNDPGTYTHRIGRTGRAGNTGKAILFVTPRERRLLGAIKKAAGRSIEEMRVPNRQQIINRRIEKFKQQLIGIVGKEDLTAFRHLAREWMREENLSALDIAAALTYSMQRERPLTVPRKAETDIRAKALEQLKPVKNRTKKVTSIKAAKKNGAKKKKAPKNVKKSGKNLRQSLSS